MSVRDYNIISSEVAIKRLVENKRVIVVAGGFFGDEAKGKLVSDLSNFEEIKAIVRTNAGQNAGHTLFYGDKKIVLHLIPSGVVTGKLTIIGNNCVGDLYDLYNQEIQRLKDAGIDYSNLVLGNISLVLPWHRILDTVKNRNSSTGKGISQINQDIVGKRAPKLEDLKNRNYDVFERSFDFWDVYLKELTDECKEEVLNSNLSSFVKGFLKLNGRREKIGYVVDELSKIIGMSDFPVQKNSKEEVRSVLEGGDKVIFEGTQSFFLSITEGVHYESATSSTTDTSGIFATSGVSPKYKARTINVIKATASRVGKGANPCGLVDQNWFDERNLSKDELKKLNIDFGGVYDQFVNAISVDTGKLEEKNYVQNGEEVLLHGKPLRLNEALAIACCINWHEYGSTTGKPRVIGFIDLLHLSHLIKYQTSKTYISCIDRLDNLGKVVVIKEYEYKGDKQVSNGRVYECGDVIGLGDELPRENVLVGCEPVYEILDGWGETENLKVGDVVPDSLKSFFGYLEDKTGCKVVAFGNSPKSSVYLEQT